MIKRLAIIGYGAIAKDVLIALSALLEKHAVEVLIVKRSALSEAEQSTLPPFVRVSQDPNQLWEFKADLVNKPASQTTLTQNQQAC